jgi:hypothetical protein
VLGVLVSAVSLHATRSVDSSIGLDNALSTHRSVSIVRLPMGGACIRMPELGPL